MGIAFKVTGLEKVLSLFEKLPGQVQDGVSSEIEVTANEIAENTRRDVPVDESFLLHSISVDEKSPTKFNVVVQSGYGGYIEFGTKSLVDVPAGLEAVAGSLRGPGNNGNTDPLLAIQGWVQRKGIAQGKEAKSAAWRIWNKIRTIGIKPHPYFFKQLDEAGPKLKQRIEDVIKSVI